MSFLGQIGKALKGEPVSFRATNNRLDGLRRQAKHYLDEDEEKVLKNYLKLRQQREDRRMFGTDENKIDRYGRGPHSFYPPRNTNYLSGENTFMKKGRL